MSFDSTQQSRFEDMGLIDTVIDVLEDLGFETPTPIQSVAIPSMLQGRDVLGQAQTGTGKTAAFALPMLSMIDPADRRTQALILVPTRELAIQLSDAFTQYSARMRRVSVLPVYGGQDYGEQFRRLRTGAHVVVGTPGRIMDHMRRGSLKLDALTHLVLDEADEMLQMGFIDDITWILEQTPDTRQTALFSATLPPAIRRIAQKHMNDPEELIVKLRTAAPQTINQRHIMVNQFNKIDALARLVEAETYDGMLVFVRTKAATLDVVEQLAARGVAAEALNGDIKQSQRERTVERFKSGKTHILVATDVAARGLDVDRISHVINFDIPHDIETYIHRVGRTGRAGRAGEAILFATYREMRMLYAIEHATKQKITPMDLPSAEVINGKRIARFKETLTATMNDKDLTFFTRLLEEYAREHDVTPLQMAAALAEQMQGGAAFLFKETAKTRPAPPRRDSYEKRAPHAGNSFQRRTSAHAMAPVTNMERYRIEVGNAHGARPGNIVGAIANEAGIAGAHICRLKMFDEYSTVDLPAGMPPQIFQILKKVWVGKRQMNISRVSGFEKHSGKDQKNFQFNTHR